LDEINKIKEKGAQALDIEKFIAEETRSTETQIKDNNFWLGYLTTQYQNEEDPKQVLKYVESLKEITPELLKSAAKTRLSDNYIRLVLLPETKN
jgi:zinc protease